MVRQASRTNQLRIAAFSPSNNPKASSKNMPALIQKHEQLWDDTESDSDNGLNLESSHNSFASHSMQEEESPSRRQERLERIARMRTDRDLVALLELQNLALEKDTKKATLQRSLNAFLAIPTNRRGTDQRQTKQIDPSTNKKKRNVFAEVPTLCIREASFEVGNGREGTKSINLKRREGYKTHKEDTPRRTDVRPNYYRRTRQRSQSPVRSSSRVRRLSPSKVQR